MSVELPQAEITASRTVCLSRTFDAPRELVFKAWSSAEALMRWYAPNGCTVEFRHLDFRTGGTFHSCIHTPDKHQCWCTGTYLEIVAPERIVFSISVSNEAGLAVQPTEVGMHPDWPSTCIVTVVLSGHGAKTELTLEQHVDEALAKQTGAYGSWLQMFDRLASELTAG